MKKILVLGGSGLVGSVFSRFSEKCYDLHLTYNTNSINDLKINLEGKYLIKYLCSINYAFCRILKF